MNHPSTGFPTGEPNRSGGLPGVEPAPLSRQGRELALSPPILGLRLLHYYLELLAAGYRQAIHPDASSRSLRGERIALGIDLPELDTVPLWASRRSDGSVSIPFVEFILDQIGRTLDAIGKGADVGSAAQTEALREARREIGSILAEATPDGDEAPSLPRLRDVYLPAPVLDRLCGPDGLTDRVLHHCTEIVISTAGGQGH